MMRKRKLFTIAVVVVIVVMAIGALMFRFDFAGGSHRILPTAVDTDLFGNYKVYYRTTEFTRDDEEPFYYIERGNTELAAQMQECVKHGEFIMIYYERYIGFKGITAPRSAPITSIEVINNG
jgi:hypothetical protein